MNPYKIRKDFTILNKPNPPVYFDNSCMTLRPVQVVKKMQEYYDEYPACGGRSHHRLGERVTEETLKARRNVAQLFSARKAEEIVFTRNTTEGINLIANSLKWEKGDKVLCSDKEHNSNLVPWIVARARGLRHETFRFNDLDDFSEKTKDARLVSIVHTSNADGTSNDIAEMIRIAHDSGALVMIDAAQSAPHKQIDVKRLDIDFLACSGHKMLGPSGTGILYGKMEHLERLSQFMVGGDTVKNTHYDSFIPEDIPERFEAGLQNYAGIIGLGEAASYLRSAGMQDIASHEYSLNKRLSEALAALGVDIIGPKDPKERAGIVSFNVKGMDPHDVALMLDSHNVMVRSGMHCVHSWFNAQGLKGSARASFYLYNTTEEVDLMAGKMKDIASLGR